MLNFSDSRKPNVIIASTGSFLLFIGSIIAGAFFMDSKWSANAALLITAKSIFIAVNILSIIMSLYALFTSYANGWLLTDRLSRPVLGSAPWVLCFWTWRLVLLIKQAL